MAFMSFAFIYSSHGSEFPPLVALDNAYSTFIRMKAYLQGAFSDFVLQNAKRKQGTSLLAFYCCGKYHDQKQLGEERVNLISKLTVHPGGKSQSRKSRRESETGTEAEALGK